MLALCQDTQQQAPQDSESFTLMAREAQVGLLRTWRVSLGWGFATWIKVSCDTKDYKDYFPNSSGTATTEVEATAQAV